MQKRIEFEKVYVLHTRPFRNTSLIVELFSETYGRVSVAARNARGNQSRFKGQLQLFMPLKASWVGDQELKTLTALELNGMPHSLNHQALFSAFYMNELLMRALHREDPHPELFLLYEKVIHQLAKGMPLMPSLRLFEKRLLEALGFGLSFRQDALTHQPLLPLERYAFSAEQGFFASKAGPFLGAHLLAIASEQFDSEEVLSIAKLLMRAALKPIIGEKRLNSRELFAISG